MTKKNLKIITLQYWGLSPDLDWTWTRPRFQVQYWSRSGVHKKWPDHGQSTCCQARKLCIVHSVVAVDVVCEVDNSGVSTCWITGPATEAVSTGFVPAFPRGGGAMGRSP